MHTLLRGLIKHATLLMLFLSVGLYAQKEGSVADVPFTLKGDTVSGKASYEFTISKKDTVINGSFSFIKVLEKSSLKNGVNAVSFEGTFEKGQKNDAWTFSNKQLFPGETFVIDDYSVKFPANGEEFLIHGNFDRSRANKEWKVIRHRLTFGAPSDTTHMSRAAFSGGHISGAFRAQINGVDINGSFNSKGELDGRWTVIHKEEEWKDERVYNNGFLMHHTVTKDDEEYAIKHIGLRDHDTATDQSALSYVAYNRDIFAFSQMLDSTLSDSLQKRIRKDAFKASELCAQSLQSFTHLDSFDVWGSLPGKNSIQTGVITVNNYPLSEQERENIDLINQKNDTLRSEIKRFFRQPQIELGKHGSEEFAFYHAVLGEYKKRLSLLDSINKNLQKEALTHFHRDSILRFIVPSVDFPPNVVFEFNESQTKKDHAFPKGIAPYKCNIDSIHRFFKSALDDVRNSVQKTDDMIRRLEKQTALSEYEETLVDKRDSAVALFQEKKDSKRYNDFHAQFEPAVTSLLENRFKEYARLELEEREDSIDYYLRCFDEVIELYDALADLPRKLNRVDDLYIKTTWNPHTMTDMDERVKERLYNAYENDVFPELIERAINGLSCASIREDIKRIDTLYRRMVAMREEDTRDREKAMRRASDYESKWAIICED